MGDNEDQDMHKSGRDNVPKLGAWLPKKTGLARFSLYYNRHLLLVVVAVTVTLLVIVMGTRLKEGGKWLETLAICLTSAFFGFTLSIWWEKSSTDEDTIRQAKLLDNVVEDEMQKLESYWQHTLNAMRTLVHNPDIEFIKATLFFLGQQQQAMGELMKENAVKIDRLGPEFESGRFVAEKTTRFSTIRNKALVAIKSMARTEGEGDIDILIEEFFGDLDLRYLGPESLRLTSPSPSPPSETEKPKARTRKPTTKR